MIVLPEVYYHRWTDGYKILLGMIAEEYDWPMHYTDVPVFPEDLEYLIIYATPQHDRAQDLVESVLALPKSVKIIGYMCDLDCHGSELCWENMKRCFDRYDVILSAFQEFADAVFPQYADKINFFPNFYADDKRYDKPLNNDPIKKVLLIGAVHKVYYPERHALATMREYRHLVDVATHPYRVWGQEYADTLHAYLMCFGASGIFRCVVAKCFEICAAGSLLIANQTPDMDSVGFKPGKHYLPVTLDMIQTGKLLGAIEDVLANPELFDGIREAGQRFVRTHHSVTDRFWQVKGIIDVLE